MPIVARAFPLDTPVTDSLDFVESLKVLYDQTSPVKSEQFWATINHFNMTLIKAQFTAGVRYDTEAYFEQKQYGVKYWMEKAFAQYEKSGLFVRGGDFYNRMGNGLALSVVRRDEFGLDNTIRGGIVQWGDSTGYFEGRVLGGSVNKYDGSSYTPARLFEQEPTFNFRKGVLPEMEDQVYGGQIVAGVPKWGFIEGRYLAGLLRVDETTENPLFEKDHPYQMTGVGMRWLNFGGHGSFAGEYAWYDLDDKMKVIPSKKIEGRAAYSRLNLNFGRVTFLAEGQDYYRFDFPYAEPPILEFEKQTFGHLPDRTDILGARGNLEYMIPVIETSVFFNYYNAQHHKELPNDLHAHYQRDNIEQWVSHGYGGFEKVFDGGAHILGSGGYRTEPEGRWWHGESDSGLPVSSDHEIGLALRARNFYGMGFFHGTKYGTYSAAPTWTWSPYLAVTARYERSDEPLVSGAAAQKVSDPNFWSGEVTVHAGQHVDVRTFYGRIRGGLVCSGGVCRNLPPFKGLQVDTTVKF